MKTTFIKKSSLLLSLMFVGVILISSCKKDDPETQVYGNASVKLVNGVSTSSAQDFYQGSNKVSTSAVAYGSTSAYYSITGGPSIVSFTNTGTTNVTIAKQIGLEEGGSYTLFTYVSGTGALDIAQIKDDNSAPPTGKAKVRFVNFGFTLNNSINITYASSGTLLLGNLSNAVSAYYNIDPNTDLGVTVIGSPVTGIVSGSNFIAGKVYTVWFDAATASTANYHVVLQN